MASRKIQSFEDLEVYQKSLQLHFEVHDLTMKFPKFELYELGSQLRRSSNSIPANIAEGWNNRHINRALGELRETQHHVHVSFKKAYITEQVYESLGSASFSFVSVVADHNLPFYPLLTKEGTQGWWKIEHHQSLKQRYNECGRMLKGLERSLEEHHARNNGFLR